MLADARTILLPERPSAPGSEVLATSPVVTTRRWRADSPVPRGASGSAWCGLALGQVAAWGEGLSPVGAEWAGRGPSAVGWCSGGAGGEEASPFRWRVRVDGEAELVDHYVVVEPTQQCEVLGVVVAAV